MRRCVIIGGAEIKEYNRIKGLLRKDDFNVFCDGGLAHEKSLDIKPHLIVGDFDSHTKPETDIETIELPCEKDDTDTVFAVKEAVKRGFEEFLLIGAVGGRFDHSLGNVSILVMLDSMGKKAAIADDYSLMEIISREPAYIEDNFQFFSLLNITGTTRDITIKNAKYPLENAEIKCDYQYGISNEVIKGQTAEVTVGEGEALLIKVF
ncbi:MAG: thiamine diphosphokinase [Firmicutes bacterium]|nr:thiamine diphosphokinase [Bacillota bacterium]